MAGPQGTAIFYCFTECFSPVIKLSSMTFSLTILGSNSALPTSEKFPTAQVLNVSERFFLIDCGEGTQMQLRRNKIKFSKINHIFISHLHGDHCFGLIGLISTLGLLGRTMDLKIFAHADLERLLRPQLDYFCAELPFKVIFVAINPKVSTLIYEDKALTVTTIPLKHRIPACGFLFREKPEPNHIRRDMIDFYKIPVKLLTGIKNGEDYFTPEGELIANERLTTPGVRPRAYAFCSDTRYTETIIPLIQGVDLLYHEATFLSVDQQLAKQTTHSTASDAARIAQKAGVQKLIIGHFSTRYPDLSLFEADAGKVFGNVELAHEGKVFNVPVQPRTVNQK